MRSPKSRKSKRKRQKKGAGLNSNPNSNKVIEKEFNLIQEIRNIQKNTSQRFANTIIKLLESTDLHKQKVSETTKKALKHLKEEADKINYSSARKEYNEKEFKEAIQNALYDSGTKKFTKKTSSNLPRPKPIRSSKKR